MKSLDIINEQVNTVEVNPIEHNVIQKKERFTFIDLFAGIGGFHLAMHNIGGNCVFSSEWDKDARNTYETNFKDISPNLFNDNMFAGDITKVDPNEIPNHDVLCAGFPCQPFSQAGYKLGFEDTRGTLFFNIAEILKVKKPKAFFLENVRGLMNHDGGKTFEAIKNTIEELGYSFYFKIVKASEFGLPQHRPRMFMVGFKDKTIDFKFPEPIKLTKTMSDIFEGKVNREIGFTLRVGGKGSPIDDRRNWDGYIVDGEEKRIGIKEGRRMQGFPENFEFPVSKIQAMKQLGNSVAVPAIQAVGLQLVKSMEENNVKSK
ncbi:MAG: DNA cytosine methyltransferase [Candidatus Izemoplasmatales bacterium]|jgi:DNA (cytosine-5)-methyltransferase 1|nr:DNA cytosine methyltransferase [Candidatus Izemoplasmatales bacterium]